MAGGTWATFTGQRSCCQHGSGITSAALPGPEQSGGTPRAPLEAPPGAPGWLRAPTSPGDKHSHQHQRCSSCQPRNPRDPPAWSSPLAVPTHAGHITALFCCPHSRKTGIRAVPFSQSRPALSLSSSRAPLHHPNESSGGFRATVQAEFVATCMSRSSFDRWRAELPFLGSRDRTSAPNSLHPNSPGPRAPPSQAQPAKLAINKDEEAPSHLDPLSFFSCTLSKWAEGQGSGKGPRRVY